MIPPGNFALFGIRDHEKYVGKYIDFRPEESIYRLNNFYQTYNKRIPEGLLRSRLEIYFHDLMMLNNISFTLDKKYPGETKFRYDFHLTDLNIYVEISPRYGKIDKITKIIDRKIDQFGCVLLKNEKDIKEFFISRGFCGILPAPDVQLE